jgi:hypothetical protein
MPAPKPGPALFLGVELSTDQLRASIVDESLELVGVESVDFDTELDYQCVSLYLPTVPTRADRSRSQDPRRHLHDPRRCVYDSR